MGICNVFGIIETSGQRPRIIFIIRIGLKEVLCILMTYQIHLSQVVSCLKNWFWTLIFLGMTGESLIF